MAAIICRHWDFLTSSSSASLTWHCDFFVEANLHARRGIPRSLAILSKILRTVSFPIGAVLGLSAFSLD